MPTLKESSESIDMATFKEGKAVATSKESNELTGVPTLKESNELIAMATFKEGNRNDHLGGWGQ